MFLLSLLDFPMFPASRNVFKGFLAQSVQELWPIKIYGSKKWPVRDLKGLAQSTDELWNCKAW